MTEKEKLHKIKCIAPFFQDTWDGKKQFEIRKDDRGYKKGDYVILREYIPLLKKYTRRSILTKIIYLLRGTVCLKKDYCVFTTIIINKTE